MDAALLLAALASRAGDRVDLLAYDRRVRARVQGRTAADVLPSLVNAMAPLEPELVETDARGLTATALRTRPAPLPVVLLTGLDAAPVEEGLLPVLPSSPSANGPRGLGGRPARRTRWPTSRGNAEAVYEAAAAAQAQRRTPPHRRTLRRHGVDGHRRHPGRSRPRPGRRLPGPEGRRPPLSAKKKGLSARRHLSMGPERRKPPHREVRGFP